MMYARKHTYLPVAAFIVGKNDISKRQLYMIKNSIGRRMINKGVVPIMVVLVGK